MNEASTRRLSDRYERPRRRWFRYGLRTLIGLTALVACGAAWLAPQIKARRDEQMAIDLLRSSHGAQSLNLLYANPFEERDGSGEIEMVFEGGPPWLTNWLGVDLFRTPVSLQAYAPGNRFSYGVDGSGRMLIHRSYRAGLSDFDLLRVKQLENLETLILEASPIGDDGAAQLADLKHLKVLNLANTQITDEALRSLAELPNLQTLNVSRTHVSDEAIEVLASYPALAEINLEMTRVTNSGIQKLRELQPELVIENR